MATTITIKEGLAQKCIEKSANPYIIDGGRGLDTLEYKNNDVWEKIKAEDIKPTMELRMRCALFDPTHPEYTMHPKTEYLGVVTDALFSNNELTLLTEQKYKSNVVPMMFSTIDFSNEYVMAQKQMIKNDLAFRCFDTEKRPVLMHNIDWGDIRPQYVKRGDESLSIRCDYEWMDNRNVVGSGVNIGQVVRSMCVNAESQHEIVAIESRTAIFTNIDFSEELNQLYKQSYKYELAQRCLNDDKTPEFIQAEDFNYIAGAFPGNGWKWLHASDIKEGMSLLFAPVRQQISDGTSAKIGSVQKIERNFGEITIESRSMIFSTIDFSKEYKELKQEHAKNQSGKDSQSGFEAPKIGEDD